MSGAFFRPLYYLVIIFEVKMTKIVAAAVKTNDGVIHFIPKPARHPDIVHALHRARNPERPIIEARGEQGFITSDGQFVDRKIAGQIAIRNKQISKLEFPPLLYSEDLW